MRLDPSRKFPDIFRMTSELSIELYKTQHVWLELSTIIINNCKIKIINIHINSNLKTK